MQPSKKQNANKRTKVKNALKKHQKEGGGSQLFAYLRFCVFCARRKENTK